MRGVRVSLSSGDVFYVKDASLNEVQAALGIGAKWTVAWVQFGSRSVNIAQIAQLSVEEIPSIERPEELPGLKEAA